jgi:hypothetical protein
MSIKKIASIALLVSFAASDLIADTFTNFAVGDVLVCFRKSGGANDLVVDAGPVATFTNATPNQRIPITQYTGSQLALVGTNSVSWSAFTWLDDSVSPADVQWTLFMSKGRAAINSKTTPWPAGPQAGQQNTAGDMGSIVKGAVVCIGYKGVNTPSAVGEPDDPSNSNPNYTQGQSYVGTLGPNSDFNGDWFGTPEKTAPANFTTAGTVIRSDFYQIPPSDTGAGSVKFLGYFELNTNGVMSYVAYPASAPTAPVITSFGRTNNLSYVSFTTGSSGTYTLRGTNDAGLSTPRINWPAISSVSGNGSINTLQDTTAVPDKFYIITAQ